MAPDPAIGQPLQDFLEPLTLDLPRICLLAKKLSTTYRKLAAESDDQFLSTPITDTILKPLGKEEGRYLAIDIGGTNLRAGFIELSGGRVKETPVLSKSNAEIEGLRPSGSRVTQTHKSWPIGEKLKQEKAEDLFGWIGECIAGVIEDALQLFPGSLGEEVPMGVTFSFPMIQRTLGHAILMSMGKGFAITSNLDLGKLLLEGYTKAIRGRPLPTIKIVAIVNDTVATLISFMYQLEESPHRKATMGLIVGTGTNATIPMKLSSLKPSKRPVRDDLATNAEQPEEVKIVVNTEWSITGAAGPLHEIGLVTCWDEKLDAECDAPGFQPFEYMTSGRYLGELGRLMIVDYLTNHYIPKIPFSSLPPRLRHRNGLATTSLGFIRPQTALEQLSNELSPDLDNSAAWQWTEDAARAVYEIGKSIEVRAAGMVAAAIIGLLVCAEEICLPSFGTNGVPPSTEGAEAEELVVGYTGGCIVHFQDYLQDCQAFLDHIMNAEFRGREMRQQRLPPRVVLQPSHDGGIIGAGVLAGMVVGLGT